MPAFAHTYAMAAPIMPGAEDDDLGRLERLDALRPAAVAVDLLQVEEERLDHVLRHLAGDEVDEVAALDLERVVEVDLRALDRRGHDVVRGGVVGALELLAQVGGERRQVHRQRRGRRRAAGDLVLLVGVPRLAGELVALRLDPRACAAGSRSSRDGDDLVDQAHLLGLGRAAAAGPAAAAHQRVDDAEHAHRAHDAAGAGQQAELHLGEADDGLGVVDDDRGGGMASAISRPPPSAAPLIAATTGLPSVSSRRSCALPSRTSPRDLLGVVLRPRPVAGR